MKNVLIGMGLGYWISAKAMRWWVYNAPYPEVDEAFRTALRRRRARDLAKGLA